MNKITIKCDWLSFVFKEAIVWLPVFFLSTPSSKQRSVENIMSEVMISRRGGGSKDLTRIKSVFIYGTNYNYTVPDEIIGNKIYVRLVGKGGEGGGNATRIGGGGGSGWMNNGWVNVTPGEVIPIHTEWISYSPNKASYYGKSGSTTTFGTYLSANGGQGGQSYNGGNGGAGGGGFIPSGGNGGRGYQFGGGSGNYGGDGGPWGGGGGGRWGGGNGGTYGGGGGTVYGNGGNGGTYGGGGGASSGKPGKGGTYGGDGSNINDTSVYANPGVNLASRWSEFFDNDLGGTVFNKCTGNGGNRWGGGGGFGGCGGCGVWGSSNTYGKLGGGGGSYLSTGFNGMPSHVDRYTGWNYGSGGGGGGYTLRQLINSYSDTLNYEYYATPYAPYYGGAGGGGYRSYAGNSMSGGGGFCCNSKFIPPYGQSNNFLFRSPSGGGGVSLYTNSRNDLDGHGGMGYSGYSDSNNMPGVGGGAGAVCIWYFTKTNMGIVNRPDIGRLTPDIFIDGL